MPELPPQKPETLILANRSMSGEEVISSLIDAALLGTTPNDRHEAIRGLATHEWQKSPKIVAAMVKAARVDSDRAVRVNAIRQMASMKMDVPYAIEHLKYMQKDRDEWIAQEATLALDKLQTK